MSRRLLIAILLVSLGFNLAVIGSMIWFRFIRPCPIPPPQGRPPMGNVHPLPIWKQLKPDSQIPAYRAKFDSTKILLMEELAKDPIDELKIHSIIDSSLSAQNLLERHLGMSMLEIRKQMSAAEAKEHFTARAAQIREMQNDKFKDFHRRKKHEKIPRN
ncbi:MAG TPA: hypothetical protein PKI59_00475 [Candidatus Cloacimonadota bacterium]|jgi:hypothetical protein|nr:hypothetical protein [Candidatus Cloacimonadota bacterium]